MATLALGIAGAAAGSMLGGPLGASIGFQVGSAVGNLLFPEKVQGPRLDDLKLHNSSYGQMSPRVWGTIKLAGNIIDEQPELTEHEETSGGKGGPEVTNFTYTCSFAVRLCERVPTRDSAILGIRRIWANGRLVYDRSGGTTVDNESLPMTIYLGTEDQLPDPTLETIHGAGNVPGYRGIAYVVFTDLQLGPYGNTLPNFNFEVYTNTAGSIPFQVSIVSGGTPNRHGATYDPDTGLVTHGDYSGSNYIENVYDLLTGALVSTDTTACEDIVDGVQVPPSAVSNQTEETQSACLGHNGPGVQQAWYYKAGISFYPNCGPVGGHGLAYDAPGAFVDGSVYSIGHPGSFSTRELCKWTCNELGAVTSFAGSTAEIQQYSDSTYRIATSDDGFIYVYYHGASLSGSTPIIDKFDSDLTLVRTWTAADMPGVWAIVGESFVVYNGMIAVTYANAFTPQTIVLYDLETLSPSSTPIGSLEIGGTAAQGISRLYGGYCIVGNGFVSLDPGIAGVPLSEIVGDISLDCGFDEADFNVSALPDLVDGYAVTQQATGRDWIQPLRDAWFFDIIEEDDVARAVKRGSQSLVTIPDDDLAAHVHEEDAPPILGLTRGDELTLPQTVNVSYIDGEADYQTGTQYDRRQVTLSKSEVTLNLQINMTAKKARSVAQTQLYTAWVERNKISLYTSRKYSKYSPTDVVTVRGIELRLVEKSEGRSGVVEWKAVQALSQSFTQPGIPVRRLDFTTSPPTVVTPSDVTALLLDLPLVDETDEPNGFYAAMRPTGTLFKSSDGGSSYSSVATAPSPAVIGATSDVLGSFYGGNVFDESNVVTVVTTGGELASATEVSVLNGANEAVVGDEVIQFKNAELIDTDTYELSGLLRGRLGTEWAMDGHGSGERFALLPVLRVPLSFSELNVPRTYKPVRSGGTVAGATAQGFTNTGNSLRPYSPVLLGGGTDASGNVTLNWTRRTRVGGAWAPFNDVPLGESAESYKVQIWNEDYSQVARVIDATSPTTTYSAADQVTDFGATQQTIFFTVGQVGAVFGQQARGTAPGAGSTNDDPISAVPPYQSPTSGSPDPPPDFDALELAIVWARPGNQRVYSNTAGAFACDKILVVSFTTPAGTAPNVIGTISAGEWASGTGPIMRTACLSTVPGDFSGAALGANSLVHSTSPTVQFSVGSNSRAYPTPELASSTTYYFNVKNDNGFGACTCFTSDCDVFVELRKPTGL